MTYDVRDPGVRGSAACTPETRTGHLLHPSSPILSSCNALASTGTRSELTAHGNAIGALERSSQHRGQRPPWPFPVTRRAERCR